MYKHKHLTELTCDRKGCGYSETLDDSASANHIWNDWGHFADNKVLCPKCKAELEAIRLAFWEGEKILICDNDKAESDDVMRKNVIFNGCIG